MSNYKKDMQDPQGQESQILRLKIVPTQGEDHQDELFFLPMTIVIQQTAALLKSLLPMTFSSTSFWSSDSVWPGVCFASWKDD